MTTSILTPAVTSDIELADPNSRLAYWKQVLPMRTVRYTAKDGSRQKADFTEQYLRDLAKNQIVDKVGFLLADADNKHTMDPERMRGDVTAWQVRTEGEKPGLYAKVVFPDARSAAAVLTNPDLGVSARIRPETERSDGTKVGPGIVHVLGTLDPQIDGMGGWETADLSLTEDEVIDLSASTYEETTVPKPKTLDEYTSADIEAMDEDALNAFLVEFAPEFDATLDADEDGDEPEGDEDDPAEDDEDDTDDEDDDGLDTEGADMSRTQADIDLANQRANEALAENARMRADLGTQRWETTRERYLSEGVPPHMLDLAAPVLSQYDDMVIDLSNGAEDESDLNVGEVVRGLLDAAKGMIDLSVEKGHSGTLAPGQTDPEEDAVLEQWTING